MKKVTIFLNVFFVVVGLWMLFNFSSHAYSLSVAAAYFNSFIDDESLHSYYVNLLIESSIYAFINLLGFLSSIAALFFFNYRFDGVSLREKIAARLAESKEKRAQSRVEKAAADKQAEIEDKQKQLEQLQAELDELKKDS